MWTVLTLIALAQSSPICWKVSGVTRCVPEGNRVTHGEHTARSGGRSGALLAFFEFAPPSGAGMGAACACTNPTGAKGEAVTWARAGSAYCTKTGRATTGLTTTSMVLCGSNLARVEADDNGVLGVRVERSGATTLAAASSEAFDNAAWTSTATVTPNTTTAPNNAATADTLSDASGAAIQSSCQTVVTASATQHTFSVYLTAGTLAKAGITMTGTGSSTGDCSNTTTALGATYTRLSCTSPAAYAGTLTAVTVCVQVGTVVGDTGTIIAWGAMHEVSAPYPTSYIPSSVGTRPGDDNFITIPSTPITGTFSIAGSATINALASSTTRLHGSWGTSSNSLPTDFVDSYGSSGGWTYESSKNSPTSGVLAQAPTQNGIGRYVTYYDGTNLGGCVNGTCGTTAATITPYTAGTSFFRLGQYSVANGIIDGVVSRICLDPNPTRCR